MFKQEILTVRGFDETLGEFVPGKREVEIFNIKRHPGTGWCVYVHGHGSDEVQPKIILNPDSVEISRP